MVGAVKQVVFVFAHLGQAIGKGRIDMDVAGRARAATAAQCQQLVKAIVADDFHKAQAIFSLNFAALAIA